MRVRIAQLSKSKTVLASLTGVVAAAVIGTTVGYTALSKDVTLTLDGESRQVSAMGGTVGDILESEGIEITDRDLVAPALDEAVRDGSAIAVQFARPLELDVDGETRTYWVNSTTVAQALGEIGRRFSGADLSASRSASIGRDGMTLDVVTPKVIRIKVGAGDLRKREVTALTVADVLESMDISVDDDDVVKPGLDTEIAEGDKVVVTRIRIERQRVRREAISHGVEKREDASIYEGEEKVLKAGVDGVRDVTYRLRFVNGQLKVRKVVRSSVVRKPVTEVVAVGTKEKPVEAAPPPNYAPGNSVWDRLAACESGGNWSINTGNGYYGGLQFSAATWRSVGGTGLPHQHSREEQIKRGQILQARAGWGQWPHCSSRLGLR